MSTVDFVSFVDRSQDIFSLMVELEFLGQLYISQILVRHNLYNY